MSVQTASRPAAELRHATIGGILRRRRRMRGRSARRLLAIGAGLVGLVMLASAIGHFALPNPDAQSFEATLAAPSAAHPFGTDDLGRDVLSRTLAATWLDLALAVGTVATSITIGVLVGSVAGYVGGLVERVLMRICDFVIAFPFMVLVLVVIAVIGPGITGMFIALTAANWAYYARIARGELLVLREKQFIQAARTLGLSDRRVMLRHVIPNLVRPSIVYSMADIVMTILFIAALSFLGVGVRPPTPEWGAIISEGQTYLLSAWWISTLPGLVLIVVGIGFSLVGDGLSERLGVHGGTAAR